MKLKYGVLGLSVIFTGCGAEIDYGEIEQRNGLIYKYGETELYTGAVKNEPLSIQGVSMLCSAMVEDGRYSGRKECYFGENKVYEVGLLNNKKHGSEMVYDPRTGDKVAIESWSEGLKSGVDERYKDGVLVHRLEYAGGRKNGREQRWSDDGAEVLTDLQWKDGKEYAGFITNEHGRFQYADGKLHGEQINRSADRLNAIENRNNGLLDGLVKKYTRIPITTKEDKQYLEILYKDGEAVSGWIRQFDHKNGGLIQEIKLVRAPESEIQGTYDKYPDSLVPDGLIKSIDVDALYPMVTGEELWVGGFKVKYMTSFSGENDYYVRDPGNDIYGYRSVSREVYDAFSGLTGDQSVSSVSSSVLNSDDCLGLWISAYREEVGQDAMIGSEQLGEWRSWCEEGKRPE